MILRDLKTGQDFQFATGRNRTTYRVIKAGHNMTYTPLRGGTHYQPQYANKLNREVIVIGQAPPVELRFTDTDGDMATFTTNTEADFLHVLIISSGGNSAITALSREDAIKLDAWLQQWFAIK